MTKHFTPPSRIITLPHTCHACGQSLSTRLFLGDRQTIFELILNNPGINSEEITKIIYEGRSEGSSTVIREMITRMRYTLKANGYLLLGRHGPKGGYTLRTNEAP